MKQLKMPKWCNQILISVCTFVMALIISGIIIAILNYNPFQTYALLFKGAFGSLRAIANTLANSTPLIFTGLAIAVAGKAGIFNLGAEGQLYFGAMCGTVCALYVGVENRFLLIALILISSIIGGMVWGGIVGVLKAKFRTNEVIVAIMLNYIAIFFTSYLVVSPLKEANSTVNQTVMINEAARLGKLADKTQLTSAFIIAIIVAILVHIIFKYTVFGYKIQAVGLNNEAAHANGINCAKYIIIAMLLSGAIASLAGTTEILGKYYRFREGFSNDFGFTGVAVAALANYNPFGVIIAAILFGALNTGSLLMSREMGISGNVSSLIQSFIVLIVATPKIAELIFRNKRKRGA